MSMFGGNMAASLAVTAPANNAVVIGANFMVSGTASEDARNTSLKKKNGARAAPGQRAKARLPFI